jgi:hypothetical protein
MRIAAGVLLLVAAAFDGCAGAAVTFLGGAAQVVGNAADEAVDEAAAKAETTAEGAADAHKVTGEVKSVGSALIGLGIYLLVMCGLNIAAGVCFFMRKAPIFIIVVGVLGLGQVALGMAFGGLDWKVIIPAAVAALAIVAAVMMKKELRGGPAAPAPAAAPK